MNNSNSPVETVAVVYNPIKVDVDEVRAAVNTATSTIDNLRLLWFSTTADDPGFGQTREALAEGATLVLAAGGDGTVRPVAEALRDTDAILGILPSGTGNLLARNLGVPLSNLQEACAVALTGATRSIDIGLIALTRADAEESNVDFLVIAGIGADAQMIANTNSDLKKHLGWLAYVDAGLRSLSAVRKHSIEFRVDRGIWRSAHVHSILFANCGLLPGNIELIPDGAIDDGLLDIVLLQPASVWGWLAIWRKVTWENRVLRKSSLGRKIIRFTDRSTRTHLSYLRGSEVELRLKEPAPFQIDGDSCGDVTALEVRVDHLGLRVRVPGAPEAD